MLITTLSFTFSVQAENLVGCHLKDAVKCPCDTPIFISCGEREGYTKATTKLEYLDVLIEKKDGRVIQKRLSNLKGSISNYWDINANQWIRLMLRGVRDGDKLSVAKNGYGISGETALYADNYAKEFLFNAKSESSEFSDC